MKKKHSKITKTLIASTLLTGIVAANPVQPSADTNAEALVLKAEKLSGSLKWQVSYEYRKIAYPQDVLGYPDMKIFNNTKKALEEAKKAVGNLSSKEKEVLQARLSQNVETIVNRAVTYIDAVSAGKKIKAKADVLEKKIKDNIIDDTTVKAYHELSREMTRRSPIISRTYGKSTRDALNATYKTAALLVKEQAIYPVSIKIEIDRLNVAVEAKDATKVNSHLEKINHYMKEAKDKGILKEGSSLTQAVTSIVTEAKKTHDDFNEKNKPVTDTPVNTGGTGSDGSGNAGGSSGNTGGSGSNGSGNTGGTSGNTGESGSDGTGNTGGSSGNTGGSGSNGSVNTGGTSGNTGDSGSDGTGNAGGSSGNTGESGTVGSGNTGGPTGNTGGSDETGGTELPAPVVNKPISELTLGSTNNANFNIDTKSGAYGSDNELEVTNIVGDVTIDYSSAKPEDTIVLQNLNITGTLHANFGEGNIELRNVTVNNLDISNVGENSIYIKGNSSIGLLTINDTTNNAHVVVSDNASIENTTILSGANLEVAKGAFNTKPFANVTISPVSNEEIELSGTFDSINITKAAKVVLAEETVIKSQVKIESAAELVAAPTAQVPKIEIKPKNPEDKVVLSGNLSNVSVSAAASIEVKSGDVQISSNTNETVNVQAATGTNVTTGRGTFTTEGTTATVVKKETLSKEANLKKTNFNDNEYFGETIYNVPAGLKVSTFLLNIVVSDFANVQVVDDLGNAVTNDAYLTESMKLKVTSEDQSVSKHYSLQFEWAEQNDYDLENFGFDYTLDEFLLDTNVAPGIYSAKINFSKPLNEEGIQGYYLGISGKKITKHENSNKYLESKSIHQVYIPKSSEKSNFYSTILNNINLKDYKILSLEVKPVYQGKILTTYVQQTYDNPVNSLRPGVEGISIEDFTDTNNVKGEIEGKISFKEANDESNISYYDVYIERKYGEPIYFTSSHHIGVVEKGDDMNGVYSLDVTYPVESGITDDIKIHVIPVNSQGVETEYESIVTKVIVDNPSTEVLSLSTPRLFTHVEKPLALSAVNLIEGTKINIYQYNTTTGEFEKMDRVATSYSNSYPQALLKLSIGKYKISQVSGDKESSLSNIAEVKPMKLSGILKAGKLSLINAISGATVKVYDSTGQVIKTSTVTDSQKATIDGFSNDGMYYVTQSVNGIESNKFVVPVNKEYTLNDIKQSIVDSFNKANITAVLKGDNIVVTPKSTGSIGSVFIDTGADLDLSIYGLKEHNDIVSLLGNYDTRNATAVTLQINEDFESFKSKLASFGNQPVGLHFSGRYNNQYFSFNVEFGQPIVE